MSIFFLPLKRCVGIAQGAHQAAFGSIPLSMVLQYKAAASKSDLEQYTSWGGQIAGVSLLSIVIGGPLGALIMRFLGPKCLEQVNLSQLWTGPSEVMLIT